MRIKKHIVGPLQVNCYVVWDEPSMEAMVIDPGGGAKKIARTVADKGLALKGIVHTHDHMDHTMGSEKLRTMTGAPVMRHPESPRTGFLIRRNRSGDGVADLEDGSRISLGMTDFEVIHTPGHSRGSIVLYSEPVLFSGDLIFKGGIGRVDLKGGDMREMVNSLVRRIAHLPDDTDVLPGHGPPTTLGDERRKNPLFRRAAS